MCDAGYQSVVIQVARTVNKNVNSALRESHLPSLKKWWGFWGSSPVPWKAQTRFSTCTYSCSEGDISKGHPRLGARKTALSEK